MCFVFIWEQTATCATYNINWLVFITEMKSFYSAVRTGSWNKTVYASSLKGWTILYGQSFCTPTIPIIHYTWFQNTKPRQDAYNSQPIWSDSTFTLGLTQPLTMHVLFHLPSPQIHIWQTRTCLAHNTPCFQNVLGVKIEKKKVEKKERTK